MCRGEKSKKKTRHRASTSMYSLTFRVRVATPAHCGRNGTASLQITSHTQQARRFYRWCVRSAYGVRWAWRITAGLCHAFPCCHSNASRAPIANPPNSAQLGGIPYHSTSYIRVRAIMWTCGRGQTHRHTDRHADARDHNTFLVVFDSREM